MNFQRGIEDMDNKNSLEHFREVRCKGQDTSGFNFFDLLHSNGSPLDALFYSSLFFPEFVEIDGMVFLKDTIEDEEDKFRLNKALKYYEGDKTKTEQSFNLIEVPCLFGKNMGETTDDEDKILAERLAKMWQSKLCVIFSDRNFTVEVISAENTGGEVGVIFYTERN